MKKLNSNFYVVAKETGSISHELPTWASKKENPTKLNINAKKEIKRVEVPDLPGAFQLLDVFTKEECEKLINETEQLGYLEDAAVSLPRNIRHNNNLVWVIDDTTHNIIWNRVKEYLFDKDSIFKGKKTLGINKRFRFYKYDKGDFFKVHSDGAWPGSAVINETLITDAYEDRFSQMTFLILLNEDFEGGATQFFLDKQNPTKPTKDISNAKRVDIRTPQGGVLCFPHGFHPLHCLHSSQEILSGVKYIIRTDILFEK